MRRFVGPACLIIALSAILLGAPFRGLASGPVSVQNVNIVGYLDVTGGGMVDVKAGLGAVGHMSGPYATTLIDVSEPSRPMVLSRIPVHSGTHSHKARICGGTLAINVETYGGGGEGAGLALFDISDPRRPKEVAFYRMGGLSTGGTGVHRFQFDCERKLVYASGSADGFQGNVTMIIDVKNPAEPREVGRWWLPGQNLGGGEKPSWAGTSVRTHHPLRQGDRLYVSLWYGGFAILDISDTSRPVLVNHVAYRSESGAPTHTALPVRHTIAGRKWLIVFDEEMGGGEPPAFMRLFDVTDERRPVQAALFQVPRDPQKRTGGRFGAHQPHEQVGPDNLVYAAWFSGGLRIIDISNPYAPAERGHFIPSVQGGSGFAESNDVFVDERGFIYLVDRVRGLHILRYAGETKAPDGLTGPQKGARSGASDAGREGLAVGY